MTQTDLRLTPAHALRTTASLVLTACGAAALAHAWFPRHGRAHARSVWRSHFRPVEPVEFAAGAAMGIGALALGMEVVPGAVRYRGGWLFDDPIRRTIRVENPVDRARIARASDALLAVSVASPFAQAVLVTAALRYDPAAAAQSALIAGESLGFTYAVMWCFKTFFGRERPCVTALRDDTEGTGAHESAASLRLGPARGSDSFISGHAAFSFAGAALMVVQARRLKLYPRGYARAICTAALATATVTAAARVAADRHYTTDVVAGALLGLLAGFVLPGVLYLRKR